MTNRLILWCIEESPMFFGHLTSSLSCVLPLSFSSMALNTSITNILGPTVGGNI